MGSFLWTCGRRGSCHVLDNAYTYAPIAFSRFWWVSGRAPSSFCHVWHSRPTSKPLASCQLLARAAHGVPLAGCSHTARGLLACRSRAVCV